MNAIRKYLARRRTQRLIDENRRLLALRDELLAVLNNTEADSGEPRG